MRFEDMALCAVCGNDFHAKEELVFDKIANKFLNKTPIICPKCVKDGVKSDLEDEDVDDEDDGIEVGEVMDDEEDEIY